MGFVREPRHAQGVQFSNDAAVRAENASQLVFLRSKSMFYETGRFRRADRVLFPRDFRRVVKSGKRGTSGSFVVVIAPRPQSTPSEPGNSRRRLGVTVSKQVGNAVTRNHVKRCIREWFRHAREGLPDRSDLVVIARRTARDLSSSEVAVVLDEIIPTARARGAG
jgi:ribonuclease P protein component